MPSSRSIFKRRSSSWVQGRYGIGTDSARFVSRMSSFNGVASCPFTFVALTCLKDALGFAIGEIDRIGMNDLLMRD
jgi:hypothetical protein